MQISLKHSTVRIVQITDSHLGEKPGDGLLGMDTGESLQHVINLVKSERPQVDLLLATGDIANSGRIESYKRFAQMTGGIADHALWLPGNHDLVEPMRAAIDGGTHMDAVADVSNWRIIMVNSKIPGEVGGAIAEAELTFLREQLQNSRAEHVMVCLHHHPINIDCEWLDEQRVSNADAFFSVLAEFDTVRAVLWGHIHQQIDQWRGDVKLMSTPSTCIQFAPLQPSFKLDRLNPGYRWLELHIDGSISTSVSRIDETFDIDYDYTGGY